MIVYILNFFTKVVANIRVKSFFIKIGLYEHLRKFYRRLLHFLGKEGLKLRVNATKAKIIVSSPAELNLYCFLDREEEFIQEVLNRINSNTVFYDIGAHVGVYSLVVAGHKVSPQFVYSWEPEPLNFKRLNENIELNNFQNVKTFPVALGNKNTTLKLYTNAREPGSLTPSFIRGHRRHLLSKRVPIVRGDDWIAKKKIITPSIIKIDVEGYELEVLVGLRETIKKASPTVFLEIHPDFLKNLGASKKEVFDFLHNLEYKKIYSKPRKGQEHCIFEPRSF